MMEKNNHIELLDRFFRGLTTAEEDQLLKDWVREPASRDELYVYYQRCWTLASDDMDKDMQEEILVNILSRIEDKETVRDGRVSRLRKIFPFLRYAAVACVAFVMGITFIYLNKEKNEEIQEEVAVTVQNGQKADIVLADGSKVYINSASKIIYDTNYNREKRILSLDGEAYFEVAQDINKPFIVKANGLEIEALGTSFNVRAYGNDNTVAVVLIEGKVRVHDDKEEKLLNPNERLEYHLLTKSFGNVEELHPNTSYLLWRSREISFYGESLEEICRMLTRMYNYDFVFEQDELRQLTYTGLIKNSSLENVLDYISQTASIRYTIKPDNTIVIY